MGNVLHTGHSREFSGSHVKIIRFGRAGQFSLKSPYRRGSMSTGPDDYVNDYKYKQQNVQISFADRSIYEERQLYQ